MNMFGLLSLIAVLALGVWWLGQTIESVQTENGTQSTYSESIDAAREAAQQLGS
jgi:hypothetical protein